MLGDDLTNIESINDRVDELARRYARLEMDDPERDTLLVEIKFLVRRRDEMKRLTELRER